MKAVMFAGTGLAAVALLQAVPALAQASSNDATAENTSETPEGTILVTAQFRAQNVQDTPLAITAVNAEMLEARSQTNIAQVADQAPSVTLKAQGPSYGPALGANIRGVGQFDYNPALEPGVGMYVDDVYYPTLTGSILDLLDLDRVEILRGPQGTLAGKNSIGGAVKLYSQRPTGSNTGYVSAGYGSRNRMDLRGSADFSLTDTISARLAGVAKRQGGYVERRDFGCDFPAGGSATFVNTAGATVPVNPAGAFPALTNAENDCVLAREGDVNLQAVRGQLRYENGPLDINIIGDFTNDDRHTAGAVLRDLTVNGVRRSPNLNPPATADLNPYGGGVIPYDARFVCGNYCNYANFYAPGDTNAVAFPYEGGVRNPTVYAGRVKYQGWGVSGQVEYDISDTLNLTAISAYRTYDTTFENDDDLSPLAHTNNTNNLHFWSFSQEVRLNGTALDDAIDYTVGGFYMKQRSLAASVSDLRYTQIPAFTTNDVVDANTKAAFVHLAWRPMDGLTLTGGLRYTDEFKSYLFRRLRPDFSALPSNVSIAALDGVTGLYDGPTSDRFDFRANVQYEVTPDISIYGQFATGFKGGGVNPRPFNARQAISVGPETLKSYEIGFKSDLFDRMLRLNIATFFSQYKGIQLSLPNCTSIVGEGFGVPCAVLVNAGDADIKGIEIETTLRPTDGLTIDGAMSYLDFDYQRFGTIGTATVGGPTNLAGPQFGDYPPYTPKWKWALGVQYEIDLGGSGTLTPRFDASYQSEIYSRANNGPTSILPGYTLANARLTWRNSDDDLSVSAEVTNLFDKYYYLTGFDLTGAGTGFSTAQPGRPREWAVSVKKSF
jgi:iron complex outermembrane receptor protein